jgi:hypothetical protein
MVPESFLTPLALKLIQSLHQFNLSQIQPFPIEALSLASRRSLPGRIVALKCQPRAIIARVSLIAFDLPTSTGNAATVLEVR